MDATDASERHNFLSLDAFPEDVFGTVVIALRVALEEIILWVLEEEPVDCAAESTVRPHDSVERNLGLVSHSLQVIADCVDSLTEGMAVWEEDQRVGPCSMSDPFPLGEMKVRSRKRGEVAPKLRLHFQIKRKRPRYDRRRAGLSAVWPAMAF